MQTRASDYPFAIASRHRVAVLTFAAAFAAAVAWTYVQGVQPGRARDQVCASMYVTKIRPGDHPTHPPTLSSIHSYPPHTRLVLQIMAPRVDLSVRSPREGAFR